MPASAVTRVCRKVHRHTACMGMWMGMRAYGHVCEHVYGHVRAHVHGHMYARAYGHAHGHVCRHDRFILQQCVVSFRKSLLLSTSKKISSYDAGSKSWM